MFAGEVVDVSEPRQRPDVKRSTDPVSATFRVAEVWKGPEQETVEVTTTLSDASCGYPFREGEGYLGYASEGLQATFCSTAACSDVDLYRSTIGARRLAWTYNGPSHFSIGLKGNLFP